MGAQSGVMFPIIANLDSGKIHLRQVFLEQVVLNRKFTIVRKRFQCKIFQLSSK